MEEKKARLKELSLFVGKAKVLSGLLSYLYPYTEAKLCFIVFLYCSDRLLFSGKGQSRVQYRTEYGRSLLPVQRK
jgi:hypothetical protein